MIENASGWSNVTMTAVYPSWGERWLKNAKAAKQKPFGRLQLMFSLAEAETELPRLLALAEELRDYGWPFGVGMSHYGIMTRDDFFTPEPWERMARGVEALLPWSDGTFCLDPEMYGGDSSCYLKRAHIEAVAPYSAPFFETLAGQEIEVIQGDLQHVFPVILGRMAGRGVTIYSTRYDSAPWGVVRDGTAMMPADWRDKQQAEAAGVRAAGCGWVPVFNSAALVDPNFETPSRFGVYFSRRASTDIRAHYATPNGNTVEAYYRFMDPGQWGPAWEGVFPSGEEQKPDPSPGSLGQKGGSMK